MPQFKIYNGPFPTTNPQLAVTTGTAIKTMLQVKGATNIPIRIKAWGVSMDANAAANGVQWSLIETGTVFGTVTSSAPSDVVAWDQVALASVVSTFFSLSTIATGYTCTSEGAIITSRCLDSQFVQPTGQYAWEFSLGNEPMVSIGGALRIRCKAAVAVNAICWALLEV